MDNKTVPSKLGNLKELVGLLGLAVQVQTETYDILSDYERRVYSLEQDRVRLISTVRDLENRCSSLEKRYSELLYRFSELRK